MKIALFRFTSNPWDIVILNAFKEALQDNKYLMITSKKSIASYKFKKEGIINRFEGVVMIAALCIYLYILFWS